MLVNFFFWLLVVIATAAGIIVLATGTEMVTVGRLKHRLMEAATGLIFVLVAAAVLLLLFLLAYDAVTL